MEKFIVAEISKNWREGEQVTPETGVLCRQFEKIINYNHQRGYSLHSFALHQLMCQPDVMNETIIAVFQRNV